MSQTLVDLLIEKTKREEKYFKNYSKYARLIKKVSEKLLNEVRVIVFGSILKKNEVAQDIDILIVSPELNTAEKKSSIRTLLWQKLNFSSPFEIHLISPEEYQNWYKNFIQKKIEI